ncbi:hypothetical protein [Acidianus brierleyi]|nr:hypothetical protein [Acidianus brierleyi]AWR95494.2 hypothetical protein DFR85_13710 [Acidianus brierleyi]
MNQEIIRRNLNDIKSSGILLEKILPNIYVNRYNIFSDIFIVSEKKGMYVHCMKHCIKGTGCVLYETTLSEKIPDIINKEFIEKLELKPIYISKKALISINTLREASNTLKKEELKIASEKIIQKINEGLFDNF